jgi:hypothetical protein
MKPRIQRTAVVLPAVLAACVLAASSAAQEESAEPASGPNFGTAHTHKLSVHAAAFTTLRSATTYDWDFTTQMRFRTDSVAAGSGHFGAALELPSGVDITLIEWEVCDSSPAASAQTFLYVCGPFPPAACTQISTGSTDLGGTPGCVVVSADPNVVIDNNNSYFLDMFLGANDSSVSFRRAVVTYQLQVSPAPQNATFNDVGTGHPFFQFIEALAASGITQGCQVSPPLYCPDAFLTRGQMAVFLARALGLHWAN